jgi:hypothetical protein
MAFERASDFIITAIICDLCIASAFEPILDDDDKTDEDVAWDQAVEDGWMKIALENGSFEHCCPTCAAKETL